MIKAAVTAMALASAGTGALAANVTCNFFQGEAYSHSVEDGVPLVMWLGTQDLQSFIDMFREDLSVEMDNALLDKLDTGESFYISSTKYGNIFIKGEDSGVSGQMIGSYVEDDGSTVFYVWSGYCNIGFGG